MGNPAQHDCHHLGVVYLDMDVLPQLHSSQCRKLQLGAGVFHRSSLVVGTILYCQRKASVQRTSGGREALDGRMIGVE